MQHNLKRRQPIVKFWLYTHTYFYLFLKYLLLKFRYIYVIHEQVSSILSRNISKRFVQLFHLLLIVRAYIPLLVTKVTLGQTEATFVMPAVKFLFKIKFTRLTHIKTTRYVTVTMYNCCTRKKGYDTTYFGICRATL